MPPALVSGPARGERTNGRGIEVVGWVPVAIMSLAALGFLLPTF